MLKILAVVVMTQNDEIPAVSDGTLRAGIIEAVRTPLGFFALSVLVFEAVFGAIALRSDGGDRTFAMTCMLGGMLLLIILVAYFAHSRPEALRGSRYHPPSIAPDTNRPTQEQFVAANDRIAELETRLAALTSLRLQVIACLGAASLEPSGVAHMLGVYSDQHLRRQVTAIVWPSYRGRTRRGRPN